MTSQKDANLLHYYVEKQVFPWRAKTLIYDALIRGKAGFLMTRPKTKCTFDALLRFVAGFLMTRQKLLYLMHYNMEKQVFSWRAKKVQICCIIKWKSRFSHDATENKVYIWCIITFRSRFSHDATKTLIFDVLLREKQVFPWHAKNSYIWCINTWKSRFSHDATENKVYI